MQVKSSQRTRRLDVEAVVRHGLREFALDVGGDLVLGCEDVVELNLRHARAHDVVHVRLDLRGGVRELVEGLEHLLLDDGVLHGDSQDDEDVVERLGLAGDRQHLRSERHGTCDGLSE